MGVRAHRVVISSQQLTILALPLLLLAAASASSLQDAQHITAILGESVVFNCNVDFPEDHPVPYVLQWEKKGEDIPVYIWYENYPTHAADEYKGRVSGVSPDSNFGQASLNLTQIRETDKGWYECKVVFLNRSPNQSKNGTWFHLDVHVTASLGTSDEKSSKSHDPQGLDVPVYIWYDSYPPHYHDNYKGRVSGVRPDSFYGQASLNLTNIKETDHGWYECKVVFLNRLPNQFKNGTWYHLDVHAPPRFSVTPEDVIYVNLGDAIILNCQAEGTPAPEILWYRDASPVEISATIGIFNDGTELRISNIRNDDIGDYTCIARNGEGQISHTARVIIAGAAVIMVPPTNQTKTEGEKVEFPCEARALPGNVTVRWYREGAPVQQTLEKRVDIRRDGSLVFNTVNADDAGLYLCEVTNGIGEPQSASAYLNVEYPAKVVFTPTVQYLPFRLGGVVQCYIKANPPLQYVTWTKERRLLEPYQTKDIVIMNNGSLLFTRVNENHGGLYACTPYNAQGTQGSSGQMEVLVRKPPTFTIEPEALYQRKMGDTVEMPCEAQEGEDTQKPEISWHRRDGAPLPKGRVRIVGGNITIEDLRRTDFGYYQCVASNEVATIVTTTQLVVEGTQPHAPYNLSANASEFSVTLTWLPGYSGGPDYKQNYTIWYREANVANWSQIPVTPPGSTQVTINRLTPGTKYEFQVIGKNALGDGMLSKVIEVRTLGTKPTAEVVRPNPNTEPDRPEDAGTDVIDYSVVVFPTDSAGVPFLPPILRPRGPKPGPPRNLTVTEISNGFLISWQAPLERAHLVQYYTIKYRTDAQWKTLNKGQIRSEDTSYLVKNLVGGKTYHFMVLANSVSNYEASEEVKFSVPARVKHKAITAGVVGGILFFIVAIILSVCAVKICNKRKRRKQEKAYNMVACRITDSRNGGQPPGVSQVPLKKHRQSRIPGVTPLVSAGCWLLGALGLTLDPGSSTDGDVDRELDGDVDEVDGPGLARIHRAPDGRFVLAASNRSSVSSSSDDGGFLPRRGAGGFARASWRRPLVSYPSQLSVRSDGSGESGARHYLTTAIVHPAHAHHHYANQRTLVPSVAAIYTPRAAPRAAPRPAPRSTPRVVAASSPADAASPPTPWSPALNFSDLSSVRTPPGPAAQQLRSIHERYAQELPSLTAIHQQQQRMLLQQYGPSGRRSRIDLHPHHHHVFVPVQPPRIRIPPPTSAAGYPGGSPWTEDPPSRGTTATESPWPAEEAAVTPSIIRPAPPPAIAPSHTRARLPPRHARHARSAPELSDRPRGGGLLVETSPESRSSSSGFGSKNTSSQQNQSSQSGSTMASEWRLPPYRPPPPPPSALSSSSRLLAQDWLSLTGLPQRPTPSPGQQDKQGCDVSVDGHYEFDAVFVGTPTRDDRGLSDSETYPTALDEDLSHSSDSFVRRTKYDNIEARVQAMKEEFAAFRQRQARRRRSPQLESVC